MVEWLFVSLYPNVTAISYLCVLIVVKLVLYLGHVEEIIKESSEYSMNILKNWTAKDCVNELINAINKIGKNLCHRETIKNFAKLAIKLIKYWLVHLYFNYNFFIYDILDNLFRIRYVTVAKKFYPIFIWFFAIIISLFSTFNALSVMYMFYMAPFHLILDSVIQMIMYAIPQYVIEKAAVARYQMSRKIFKDVSLANNDVRVHYASQYTPLCNYRFIVINILAVLPVFLLDIISSMLSVIWCIAMLFSQEHIVEAMKISPILDEDRRKDHNLSETVV